MATATEERSQRQRDAMRKAAEAEYMALAPGVGIVPDEYRNGAYKKLGAEPGTLGILLDDDESRARRGAATRGIDEDKLGAAIGAALGIPIEMIVKAQAELGERLDSIEAAATEPEPKPKSGKQS